MIFRDPATVRLWIDIFFAIAAAAVAFAFVALTVGIRDLRRTATATAAPVAEGRFGQAHPEPTRHAA
jgi:hypothetical protein